MTSRAHGPTAREGRINIPLYLSSRGARCYWLRRGGPLPSAAANQRRAPSSGRWTAARPVEARDGSRSGTRTCVTGATGTARDEPPRGVWRTSDLQRDFRSAGNRERDREKDQERDREREQERDRESDPSTEGQNHQTDIPRRGHFQPVDGSLTLSSMVGRNGNFTTPRFNTQFQFGRGIFFIACNFRERKQMIRQTCGLFIIGICIYIYIYIYIYI